MILNKWNYETREYEKFDSPAKNVKMGHNDMEELIECANCAKEMTVGVGYTSRTIHTYVGFGYPVCEECYKEEVEEEKQFKLNKEK